MLYTYGVKVGAKLLAHGHLKQSLKYLIIPVGYWRVAEFSLVWDTAAFQSGDRILDIGSPKLLSLYLARTLGAQVFATDIEDYFVEEFATLRQLEGVSPEVFHTQVEDGRRLSFVDDAFDKVYAISVVEHIPEEGDVACAREIGRVLAPGGRCMITVPFSPTSEIDYMPARKLRWAKASTVGEDGLVFFQRRYSEQDLFDRLIAPSGLALKHLHYVGERVLTGSTRELAEFMPKISGPLHPLLSKLFHTRPATSWRELKKPLCALVVLEKPLSGGTSQPRQTAL